MKKAENNEMELLLRSLARREGNRSFPRERVTDGSAHSAHLDADELSSYAERTLPAATRARYTLHLADCARCRKIVAELAPAVSVSVRDHPDEQGVGNFWQTVRHLFSLPMWRYAVPALGLFAIVMVGVVVFRQQSLSGLTARNARPMPEQVEVPQNHPTEMPPQEKAAAKSEPLLDSYSDLNAQQKAKSNEQPQAGEGAGAVAPAVIAKDAAVEKDAPADKTAAAAPQPTFAPEPAAPPAPKPQDQVAAARKETNTQTEAAARPQSNRPAKQPEVETDRLERNAENRVEDERARGRAEKGEGQAGATVSSAAPGRDYIGQRKAQTLRTDVGTKAGDETAETRAVAGRRFRRQGNLWIDTAYQSGSSLTVISRGSEQYRALVADEPSVRTVAEQLQGEIILVWKGRGYRIR